MVLMDDVVLLWPACVLMLSRRRIWAAGGGPLSSSRLHFREVPRAASSPTGNALALELEVGNSSSRRDWKKIISKPPRHAFPSFKVHFTFMDKGRVKRGRLGEAIILCPNASVSFERGNWYVDILDFDSVEFRTVRWWIHKNELLLVIGTWDVMKERVERTLDAKHALDYVRKSIEACILHLSHEDMLSTIKRSRWRTIPSQSAGFDRNLPSTRSLERIVELNVALTNMPCLTS